MMYFDSSIGIFYTPFTFSVGLVYGFQTAEHMFANCKWKSKMSTIYREQRLIKEIVDQ